MTGMPGVVTLVFAPIEAPEVQYSVEGTSVEDVAERLYNAWSLHGDLVVEPFSDGQTTFRNVTQVFANALNNTFDDIDASWDESGQVTIRGL